MVIVVLSSDNGIDIIVAVDEGGCKSGLGVELGVSIGCALLSDETLASFVVIVVVDGASFEFRPVVVVDDNISG